MEGTLADISLIERARAGDRDAFGELVRRHRAQAFDWARSFARDPHLAEDIVQEALLRAFMHLGTLAEMDRFLPWLHRIVRNEALMKLRKGENSGRERTFTGIVSGREASGVDWGDLDSILHYLSGQKERIDDSGNPPIRLAQKEFLDTIRHLLRCLTPKERAVFEAHFFRQLSPSEIARLFRTTTDNVYSGLYSRAEGGRYAGKSDFAAQKGTGIGTLETLQNIVRWRRICCAALFGSGSSIHLAGCNGTHGASVPINDRGRKH